MQCFFYARSHIFTIWYKSANGTTLGLTKWGKKTKYTYIFATHISTWKMKLNVYWTIQHLSCNIFQIWQFSRCPKDYVTIPLSCDKSSILEIYCHNCYIKAFVWIFCNEWVWYFLYFLKKLWDRAVVSLVKQCVNLGA